MVLIKARPPHLVAKCYGMGVSWPTSPVGSTFCASCNPTNVKRLIRKYGSKLNLLL